MIKTVMKCITASGVMTIDKKFCVTFFTKRLHSKLITDKSVIVQSDPKGPSETTDGKPV